ncbi:MAG TPA: hypothetical protein VK662_11120 [Acidothermaceae bacterium]|jgi:hypothetical protein|nr:hypothetical protein [Acidothermaceae bacterium]
MAAALRRRIGDAFLFTSGAVIVVSVLVAANQQVRERASMLIRGDRPLGGLGDIAGRAGDLVRIAAHVALRFGVEHPLLTVFAVAGAVLVAAVSWL